MEGGRVKSQILKAYLIYLLFCYSSVGLHDDEVVQLPVLI